MAKRVKVAWLFQRCTASFPAPSGLTIAVDSALTALCAEGLMMQAGTGRGRLTLTPGEGDGFRLKAPQLTLDTALHAPRRAQKTVSAMSAADAQTEAFWDASLYVCTVAAGGRFLLPAPTVSQRVNHIEVFCQQAVKLTCQGTGNMGGLASGQEWTAQAGRLYRLDYLADIQAGGMWVVS